MRSARVWVSSRSIFTAVFSSLLALQMATSAARAQQWYISDTSFDLWNYTQGSGSAVNPRAISPIVNPSSTIAGIAISPTNGKLYALTTFGDNALYTVNPTTGATTDVGPTGLTSIVEGDISFDPTTGILYGATNLSGHQLFTLNTTTGAATDVGSMTGSDDPSGLAFDSSGQLWMVDTHINTGGVPSLSKVNKTNGAIESTVSLGLDLNDAVLGASFDPLNGQLYMADDAGFYQINTTTGLTTEVDTTGVNATGLAFVPVPEPTVAGLLVVSGASMLLRRRRTC